MAKKSIFEGESIRALFVNIAYKLLMKKEWVSLYEIMRVYLGPNKEYKLARGVSNSDDYGELRKAISVLSHQLNDHEPGCVERRGSTRNREYSYVGKDTDPLKSEREALVINDIKRYWQFCQDSAGFFPESWLDYFFKNTRDLLDIKRRRQSGSDVMSTSLERELRNVEMLPVFYDAIRRHQVLEIDYKPYNDNKRTIIFHPHYLKEFNGRWFLFGLAEGSGHEVDNLALDRIVSQPRERDLKYVPAPQGRYPHYFADIVGVSHYGDREVKNVRLRVHGKYVFNLIETKPFHKSQRVVTPYSPETDYGEFELTVEINNELIGLILHYGNALEVTAPDDVRDTILNSIKNMLSRYKKQH